MLSLLRRFWPRRRCFGWYAAPAAAGIRRCCATARRRRSSIDLRRDADYDIDTGRYTIHLHVENGGIAFVDSPCPDHLCEGFGVLKNEGDWAACMPAKASLTIE